MLPCTYIDGIASSQAIDTAGEIVDIQGLDCSSLLGAAFNYEHKSDVPAQIVGKVLEFKKIFSEKDCESDRQKMYWQKINMPFLYVLGRLFDDKKESSKEIAALFRDDAENPNEPKMVGFSIEGAKVNKEGMTITRSIARKVTITNMPANKTCIAEMVPAQKASRNDPDSLFKGEIEFFNPNDKYLEFLQKREQDMNKDVGSGGGAMIGSSLAMNEMKKSLPWSPFKPVKTGAGVTSVSSSHAEHGMVGIGPHPSGKGFRVTHAGKEIGSHPTAEGAMGIATGHQKKISENKTFSPAMHNRASPQMPNMGKSLEAGSSLGGAPSSLTQGAALQREDLGGKVKKSFGMGGMGGMMSVKTNSSQPKEETAGVGTAMNTTVGKSEKKSKWLARAEEAYRVWEKKEQFENFMAKKMPHLTKGEIQAIGQTLALKKSVEAEKSLSKFATFFNKSTDIMMAKEGKK